VSGTVGILDVGFGTVRNLANMLENIGYEPSLVTNQRELLSCTRLILPGVGSFDSAMQKLESQSFEKALPRFVEDGGALLGVCLGMQILGMGSLEGSRVGLGILNMSSTKLKSDSGIRNPHMGWNEVFWTPFQKRTEALGEVGHFYFNHSFAIIESELRIGLTTHGENFSSAVLMGRVMGVQFHPEKSHRHGRELLRFFVEEI
jgi:glutamine amidotransferase